MREKKSLREITTTLILLCLIILSFLLIRPFIYSIIIGIIIGIIFYPLYLRIFKKLKSKNLSAFLICILFLTLIILPLWFLIPVIVKQSIKIFQASRQIDFITPLKSIFPEIFASESFSNEFGSTISSFIVRLTSNIADSLSNLILNFMTIFLQLLIVFFILFFVLREKDELMSYIRSLSPFSKDIEKKLFKSTKDITLSVLYGRIVLGIAQGLIAGIGFFVFKVPNAVLLTLFASLAGVFPIVGTVIVWLPVAIFYLISGEKFISIGIIAFGILATIFESIFQPIFISKMIRMNSSVALVGMIGGLFTFGIIGVIIGPLILAYLLIVLEIYRNKRIPGAFSKED